ncbi:molybdenum cofactor biosynthesis protein [Ceratobasidium sp. AG-Ba]|nr:molybdenum cofactor biosynthesis protein [Ceratobasidium sp. AG-Ba]
MIARRVAAKARIASIDRDVARGTVPALVDSFGRKHDYLRISLTERCNLRCRYCMPAEGIPLSPSASILTNTEVIRLARIFVQHGVNKIRLTGGEPTLRQGLPELIQELKSLGVEQIGMTSNGIALWRKLPELVRSGLTHLNLSLDTLDPDKFERMTLRKGHDKVIKSLDTALSLLPPSNSNSSYPHPHLKSVKLNTVLIRNTNDSELARFLALTRSHPLSVRFIEFMPFAGNQWDANAVVTASELLTRTRKLVSGGWFDEHVGDAETTDERVAALPRHPTDTARSYQIRGFKGTFGFISSMSDDFCSGCNRLRITADGNFKPCLFDKHETSLRDLLRSNSPTAEQEIIAAVRRAVGGKFAKHGVPNSSFSTPEDENNEGTVREAGSRIGEHLARPMILIGGSQKVPSSAPSRFMHPRPLYNSSASPHAAYASSMLSSVIGCHAVRSQINRSRWNHSKSSANLTHIDPKTGRACMVDVSDKDVTHRSATAVGRIVIPHHAYKIVKGDSSTSREIPSAGKGKPGKGDVLSTAQLAGIMAAKRTSDLIPLCHPLPINHIEVILEPNMPNESTYAIAVRATVRTASRTGVEMEALTAANVALLTVWDMLKAVAGQEMMIEGVCVARKEGGASGLFERSDV